MRQPHAWKAEAIQNWTTQKQLTNGKWVPARPEGGNVWSWKLRWKLAYTVLVGEADVLLWD